MEHFLFGMLDTIGGSNIVISDAGSSLNGINGTLKAVGTVIGGIMVMLAAVKIVLAIAEENVGEKTKASMLMGTGILFVSISAVLELLGVEGYSSATTAREVGGNVVQLVGTMCTWAGGTLLMGAVLMLVFALAQEQPEGRAGAVKLMTVSIGLLGSGAMGSKIKTLIAVGTVSGNTYMGWIATFVSICATYAGAGYAIIGVYHYVLSIRNEDTKERDAAARLLMTAAALLSFRAVLGSMGITVTSSSLYGKEVMCMLDSITFGLLFSISEWIEKPFIAAAAAMLDASLGESQLQSVIRVVSLTSAGGGMGYSMLWSVVSTAFSYAQPFGYALLVTYFLMYMFDAAAKDQVTVESIVKVLIELVLVVAATGFALVASVMSDASKGSLILGMAAMFATAGACVGVGAKVREIVS